jgi:hypothetical protein
MKNKYLTLRANHIATLISTVIQKLNSPEIVYIYIYIYITCINFREMLECNKLPTFGP